MGSQLYNYKLTKNCDGSGFSHLTSNSSVDGNGSFVLFPQWHAHPNSFQGIHLTPKEKK